MRRYGDSASDWEAEARELATDADIVSLWHSFGRAAVLGEISYPSGDPISVLPTTWDNTLAPWDNRWITSSQVFFSGTGVVADADIDAGPVDCHRVAYGVCRGPDIGYLAGA